MVLHKSKWDRKAKSKYQKKHGIQAPEEPKPVKTKWSSKKASNVPRFLHFDEDDSDWDSEDDALLDHFYPQLGETQLSIESKLALKKQIINALMQHTQGEEEVEEEPREFDELDGIYLGTRHEKPEEIPEEGELEIDEEASKYLMPKDMLETKIVEYLSSDIRPQKNRKMLKNKMSDNLLDEYGLESYTSTVKDTDYNKVSEKKSRRDLEKLGADDLHGFRIGESFGSAPKKENIRELTEEEKEQHSERAEKLESAKLREQIKRKFGATGSQVKRIIEINNINENDERAMGVLNKKLAQAGPDEKNTLEDDLEILLGSSGFEDTNSNRTDDQNLDALLSQLDDTKITEEAPRFKGQISKQDEDFLDELLG